MNDCSSGLRAVACSYSPPPVRKSCPCLLQFFQKRYATASTHFSAPPGRETAVLIGSDCFTRPDTGGRQPWQRTAGRGTSVPFVPEAKQCHEAAGRTPYMYCASAAGVERRCLPRAKTSQTPSTPSRQEKRQGLSLPRQ